MSSRAYRCGPAVCGRCICAMCVSHHGFSLVGPPWSLFLAWVARERRLAAPAATRRPPAPASEATSFARRLVRSKESVRLGVPECGPDGGCGPSVGAAGGSAGLANAGDVVGACAAAAAFASASALFLRRRPNESVRPAEWPECAPPSGGAGDGSAGLSAAAASAAAPAVFAAAVFASLWSSTAAPDAMRAPAAARARVRSKERVRVGALPELAPLDGAAGDGSAGEGSVGLSAASGGSGG